ncbi:hypothetical protein GCM10010497_23790 [Streptomyces cinereoruber]|uniref:Uncharacterized protein n=1 Tax=Streptomyces cinereoruber TaxID=67260 RepID=A0AAV4KFD5_9ACTN|nr:hypothetical protein CP977_33805 [Streptomyces cinereoruber]GGR20709.1 hypothetical protein GCM10010497_23790 [Streptomyces cinereoruber]
MRIKVSSTRRRGVLLSGGRALSTGPPFEDAAISGAAPDLGVPDTVDIMILTDEMQPDAN